MAQQANLICSVCNETEFHLKEGFYYCNECGTKSDKVFDIEIVDDEEFDGGITHTTKIKIKTDTKGEKPDLTSWECYNYILLGMVQELLDMGAKSELKAMVFQIWAAFLRNHEVAFFSRHPELPRMPAKFEERDVSILYNHAVKRNKTRREKRDNASSASGSRRSWRKQMKQFDHSQYEASLSQSMLSQSFLSQSSFGETSMLSSGSASFNAAIQLKFSSKARKYLKQKMSLAHLRKHENDFTNSLKCHNMNIKYAEMSFGDRTSQLNLKLMYAILVVALNLIEDDIQLTDFLRFIAEGHISTSKIEQFFPPDKIETYAKIITSYRFNLKSTEVGATQLREQCSHLAKSIHLHYFKTPDILKLVKRYTLELNLPEDLNTFIERLINLHPPKMEWDKQNYSPCYESRAMAYIIFALKLLFGIDGYKEKKLTNSARRVNAELAQMNPSDLKELFVWDDWVDFIELRKVILSKHKLSMCEQFNVIPPKEMYLDCLGKDAQSKLITLSKEMVKRQENIRAVFQHFLHSCENENQDQSPPNFTPSLTPCHNYLKCLKLDQTHSLAIPDILNVDHTKRFLFPFLASAKSEDGKPMDGVQIACTSKQNYVGMFKNQLINGINANPKTVELTDDCTPWNLKIEADKPAETIFKPNLEYYSKRNYAQMIKQAAKTAEKGTYFKSKLEMELEAMRLTKSSRRLDRINLFTHLNVKKEDSASFPSLATLKTKLKSSNFDCWILMGKSLELNDVQTNELKRSLNLSFYWLLETCANTIGVDWRELYDQLMVLEMFFAHGIEPLENIHDRIIFQKITEVKDINKLLRHFQAHW